MLMLYVMNNMTLRMTCGNLRRTNFIHPHTHTQKKKTKKVNLVMLWQHLTPLVLV